MSTKTEASTSGAPEKLAATVKGAGKTTADLSDSISGAAQAVRDGMSSAADAASAAAGPALDAARETVQDYSDQAYQRGKIAVQGVRNQMEGDPLLGALVAFAIGYGVSYLLHSKH